MEHRRDTGLPVELLPASDGSIRRFGGSESWASCEARPLSLFVGVEPPTPTPELTTVYLPLVRQ